MTPAVTLSDARVRARRLADLALAYRDRPTSDAWFDLVDVAGSPEEAYELTVIVDLIARRLAS